MSEVKVHKPVLIVIAGPNGSGKTSVTSKLLHHEWMEDAVYINPDIVAQEKFGDWNSPTAVMQSVKYCEALREKCLHDKHILIFETVLSRDDKVDFIRRAHELFFLFVYFSFVRKIHKSMHQELLKELWRVDMTYLLQKSYLDMRSR